MKTFFKDIKSGLTIGIVFLVTVVCGGIVYAATISHVTDGDTLTALKWNELVDATSPSGMVAAFNLSNCPTGWSMADGNSGRPDLKGQFIRGWSKNISSPDPDSLTRALGSVQDATAVWSPSEMGGGNDIYFGEIGQLSDGNTAQNYDGWTDDGLIRRILLSGTFQSYQRKDRVKVRPTNVALLYCIKD